jgi:hypothetical protein
MKFDTDRLAVLPADQDAEPITITAPLGLYEVKKQVRTRHPNLPPSWPRSRPYTGLRL